MGASMMSLTRWSGSSPTFSEVLCEFAWPVAVALTL